MTEYWRSVPDYPSYEVSSLGQVRTWRKRGTVGGRRDCPHILKQKLDRARGVKCPYLSVNLWRNGKQQTFRVHAIVLLAFAGPCPVGKEGSHLDGDFRNNSSLNLLYKSHADNCQDRIRHGTQLHGSMVAGSKLTEHTVVSIANRLQAGERAVQVSRDLGVSKVTISKIVHGKIWKRVVGDRLEHIRRTRKRNHTSTSTENYNSIEAFLQRLRQSSHT